MSLALQLEDLKNTVPKDFDPEDLNFGNERPDEEDDLEPQKSSGREHYLDVGPSSFRNKIHDIEDPKYVGRRISRKDLEDESEHTDAEEPEQSYESSQASRDGEEESSDEEELDQDDEESRSEDESVQTPPEAVQKKVEDCNKPDEEEVNAGRVNDLKKAKAVKRQGLLCNALVDARIRMQKSVVQANRLPSIQLLPDISTSESMKRFIEASLQLSEDISNLQRSLLIANEDIQPPASQRRKLNLEAKEESASWSKLVSEATNDRNSLESALHPHLLQVLNKWSTRINAISPSALLSARTTSFRSRSNRVKGAAELVDDVLVDDKVLGRTRVLRNSLTRIVSDRREDSSEVRTGEDGKNVESIWEIFDDTDFYHQILRDVVDAKKNADDTDLVPLRPQKIKKKVDTRASKGRKIRYTVHDKIQSFMVPISKGTWHEEQTDELFASLFGKGTTITNEGSTPILSDGFKLFD